MPLDIKGFVTPEQDFSQLAKLGEQVAAQKKAEAKAAEEQKAAQGTMMTMLQSMTDPKDYLSGAPTDPQVVKGFSDIYQKGLNLISGTKGLNNNMLAMALAPDIAKLSQYGTVAKVIKKGLDEGISKFTEDSGYDKNALYDIAKKEIFFNDDGTPRDLNNIDVTTDPFAKVIQKHPELVTTSRGLDNWLKNQEKNTLSYDVTIGTKPGTVKKKKIEVSAPAWAMPEIDGKGKFTEKIIPKYEVATDDGEQIFHEGQPVRLLPEATYNSIMNQSPAVANYIKGQALKYAKEYQDKTGQEINPQSDKFNLLARGILYDELKNRSAGTFKTIESQVATTRAEPKGITIGRYDPTGGGQTSGVLWDEMREMQGTDFKGKKLIIKEGSVSSEDGNPYSGNFMTKVENLPGNLSAVMKAGNMAIDEDKKYVFNVKDGIIQSMETPQGLVTRDDMVRMQEAYDKERKGEGLTWGVKIAKKAKEAAQGIYKNVSGALKKAVGGVDKKTKIKGTDQKLY